MRISGPWCGVVWRWGCGGLRIGCVVCWFAVRMVVGDEGKVWDQGVCGNEMRVGEVWMGWYQ